MSGGDFRRLCVVGERDLFCTAVEEGRFARIACMSSRYMDEVRVPTEDARRLGILECSLTVVGADALERYACSDAPRAEEVAERFWWLWEGLCLRTRVTMLGRVL